VSHVNNRRHRSLRDIIRNPKRLDNLTIKSINEKIGFWVKIRAMRSKVQSSHEMIEYEWMCGCDAIAVNGIVLQMVSCVTHGGDDYDSLD
jgi:hypothetical protein